jgi:hypothetical protein
MRRNLVGFGVGVWIGALVVVAMAQEGQTGPQNDPTSSTSPTTTEAKMPKLAVDRVSTAEEVMQELLLGQKVDKLVDQWTKAESESDRETIHKQLYDAVKAQSEARLAIQEKEIAPLEVKVKQLRSQLELRRKKQEEIVVLRVQELLRDQQGLGWGADPAAPPGTRVRTRTRTSGNQVDIEREINVQTVAGEAEEGQDRSVRFSGEKLNNEIMKWRADTWQIELALNMPGLDPEAVQYAILDQDPVPAYISQVKLLRPEFKQQIEQADSKSWKEVARLAQMRAAWDMGFKDITGANLYLLTKKGSNLSSNGRAGQKWVVTRTVDVEGRPVCWCIPIEVKMGKKIDISFDKSNTFDLQTPYDKAIGEQAGPGDKDETK